jgi:hypothetical protein
MRKIIALLILFAGVSILVGLWPLPNHLANEFRNDAVAQLATPPPADSSPELEQSRKNLYQKIINDPNLEIKFWLQWLTKLALFACCLVTGLLMLVQVRFWAASVLVCTAFYALTNSFFLPFYNYFMHNTTSFAGFLSRLDIVAKYPSLLFNILWFNVTIPLVFIIGSGMAIKSIMVHRKGALTHHSSGTPNGAP